MATLPATLLFLMGLFGLSVGQTEWHPPLQDKFYRAGEPTTIFTPGDGSYNYAWYLMEDRSTFTFRVKSCHSAHIILSAEVGVGAENSTEILLGDYENSKSYIRRLSDSVFKAEVSTPQILHCNDFRTFWIRWVEARSRTIEVGYGPNVGEQMFMKWEDEHHHYVRGVGLAGAHHSAASWEVNENTGEQLMVLTSNEHKYERIWKSVRDRHYITFNVMACGHVHIVLTRLFGKTDSNVVEIVIGGWDNTLSVIRKEVRGHEDSELARAETPNILSCAETREFWISWAHGVITVGHGARHSPRYIMKGNEPISFKGDVRFAALSTGFGVEGTWLLEDETESISYLHSPYISHEADLGARYNTTWIESPRKEYFKFSVLAGHDASIHLSEHDSIDPEFGYEIIIGAEGNTKIVLIEPDWMGYVREVYAPEVLDRDRPLSFWISWSGHRLRMGYGLIYYHQELWTPFTLPSDFQIRSLALATVGNSGEWRLRETAGEYLVINTPSDFNMDRLWRTMRNRQDFVFQVKACSDAHVIFSPMNGVDSEEWFYDLVICGWVNSNTMLRKRKTGEEAEDASPAFPCEQHLKCDGFVDMWVSWYDNILEAGMGPHALRHSFFSHVMEDGVLPIKAVSISTGWGYEGQWRIEEDNGDQLTHYTNAEYDTNQFWLGISHYVTWYTFTLRACHEAVIYLSPEGTWTSPDAYEIVIGSSENTRSQVRRADNKEVLVVADTPNVLSCESNRHFWAGWKDGIQLGKGRLQGMQTLIQLDLSNMEVIRGISMTQSENTGDNTGRWQVVQNAAHTTWFTTGVDYEYQRMWSSVVHAHHVTFGVTACSDVHVALSERITYHHENAYEVVLGGWDNTKSVIRQGGRWDKDYATVDHEDEGMVSCDQHRHFWIQWRHGAVVVGRGNNPGDMNQRIMDYHPLSCYDIRYIGFTTGTGASGNWSLQLMEETYTIPDSPGGSSGLSAGEIAAIVFGCLAIVLIALLVAMVVLDRRGCRVPSTGRANDQSPIA